MSQSRRLLYPTCKDHSRVKFVNQVVALLRTSTYDWELIKYVATIVKRPLKLSTCAASRSATFASPAFALSKCFSTVLDGFKYASSHEWVKHDGPVATIGITDHAQDHLEEVVFVELPEAGKSVSQGSSFGAVESVKATSDVNSPISGEVVEVNTKLSDSPGLINSSPYEDGWMIKVKPSNTSELESLMGANEYTTFCEEENASH